MRVPWGWLGAIPAATATSAPAWHASTSGAASETDTTIHEETGTALPSGRCAVREEWQPTCQLWSGRLHNRYLLITGNKGAHDGLGVQLAHVGGVLGVAISFDIQPVFDGFFVATHGTPEWSGWFGITNPGDSVLVVHDVQAFQQTQKEPLAGQQNLESPAYWQTQENRTSVTYVADAREFHLNGSDWGARVSPGAAYDDKVCKFARLALRQIYWWPKRSRCHRFLPGVSVSSLDMGPRAEDPQDSANASTTAAPSATTRPWVVGVHVRRGDIWRGNKSRIVPHLVFVEMVRAVLQGIAQVGSTNEVTILVFSEASPGLAERELMDENSSVVTWDIHLESCQELGLNCHQEMILTEPTMFDTFECLTAVDVIVGSESLFSESVSALSTNVKVIPIVRAWPEMLAQAANMPDRVAIDPARVLREGRVDEITQASLDTTIANWWHCLGEAEESSARGEPHGKDALSFYETVDGWRP